MAIRYSGGFVNSTTGLVLLLIVLFVLLTFGVPWVVMLFLGAAHSQDARIPAFGYWATFWLSLAIQAIVTSCTSHNN